MHTRRKMFGVGVAAATLISTGAVAMPRPDKDKTEARSLEVGVFAQSVGRLLTPYYVASNLVALSPAIDEEKGEGLTNALTGMFELWKLRSGVAPIDMPYFVEAMQELYFSNGNDGILIKGDKSLSVRSLKGRRILLVEGTVSHYMLARALTMNGLTLADVKVVNASDSDIGSAFATGKDGIVAVTWHPILMNARNVKGAQLIFDSSKIPGEIIDGVVVHSDTPDAAKKAWVGAWFEIMSMMKKERAEYSSLVAELAKSAGGTVAEFEAQLRTTSLFLKAADAVTFATSPNLKATMDQVRKFAFENKLFGDVKNVDQIGIMFPDGSTLGDSKNVMLEFDIKYMKLAAEGKL